jgi:hypothetical protein
VFCEPAGKAALDNVTCIVAAKPMANRLKPPDIASILPFLLKVVGDTLGRLRRASVEILLEVDVNPHVVRPISRHEGSIDHRR